MDRIIIITIIIYYFTTVEIYRCVGYIDASLKKMYALLASVSSTQLVTFRV